MTPELIVRAFTNDQYVLDKVIYSNFYRMKGFKENDSTRPLVVDIGGHCGYFSFCALSLGARKVYAVEPFVENYKVLLKNLGNNPPNVFVPHCIAIYVGQTRLPFNYPKLQKGFFDLANFSDIEVTDKHYLAPAVTLDEYIGNYVSEDIDLLKISIGYSEVQILKQSALLASKVAHVCGEASLNAEEIAQFKTVMTAKGFKASKFESVEGEEGKSAFFFAKDKLENMFI